MAGSARQPRRRSLFALPCASVMPLNDRLPAPARAMCRGALRSAASVRDPRMRPLGRESVAIVGRHARTTLPPTLNGSMAWAKVKFQSGPVVRPENRRRLLWVGTASSRGKEAVVGAARPPIRNPRSAVPRIAAARASAGGRTERRLDGGHREYVRWRRPAPHAAQRTIATQDRKLDASTSLREHLSPSAVNGTAAHRDDRPAEASPPVVCHHTPSSVD
jgi:hypothetical protein